MKPYNLDYENFVQFLRSLQVLDRELDVRHTKWRSEWIRDLRDAQSRRDADVKRKILAEREVASRG